MKLNLLKMLLPNVYHEEHSDSFENLFNCAAKHLDYSGLNFRSTKFLSATYQFKRVVSLGLLAFCIALVLKEILTRKWEDELYFNVSLVIGSILMVGPRVLQMFLYRNELNELVECVIKNTHSDRFSYLPELESQLHEKYLNISRLMSRVLILSYHFVAMLAVYLPIVTKEWFLLFFTVAPWLGYKSHPGYEISLILESFVVFFVVGFMEAFDNYFYYFTFYVLMKSDLCITMISKIGDLNSEYNDANKQSFLIRQLCQIQVDLQCFLTKFRKIFVVYVFGQGAFSLFGMTLALIMMKSSLLNFFVLFTIMSTQLFLLCFFGEMVLLKASGISNGIYCSHWYKIKNIKDRETLLHLLHNSQKKITFSAMGVFDFSLATFAAIIQKAYGFYAFMQNIM